MHYFVQTVYAIVRLLRLVQNKKTYSRLKRGFEIHVAVRWWPNLFTVGRFYDARKKTLMPDIAGIYLRASAVSPVL